MSKHSIRSLTILLTTFLPVFPLFAQTPPTPVKTSPAEKAVQLARQGHCKEAIPALRRVVATATSPTDLRKNAAIAGLRCALAVDDRDAANSFLQLLQRQFPQDPDILFIVVHAYSDLSTRAAQDLGRIAPQSIPAQKLMAEAFEMQGNWDQAQHEYEVMIAKEPNTLGLHYLYGRSLLSEPNVSPEKVERARQQFEKELEIDPNNAGAHYILGELARQRADCEQAVPHFSQATKLDPNFGEAYLGAGSCLITLKKYDDAVAQLRIAERLMPFNGSVHYALATALSFSGQKEEAQKEFAMHRKLTAAAAPRGAAPAATPPSNDQPQ
jgi:tetratricopeptide (TPR) repeat protein